MAIDYIITYPNDIFGFVVSSGLTQILPIDKCIIFFRHPVLGELHVDDSYKDEPICFAV